MPEEAYHDINVLMKIFTGRGESLGRGILKVPQLVFHTTVEFFRVPLPLEMKLDTDCSILC